MSISRRTFLANAAALPIALRGRTDPLGQLRRHFKGTLVVAGEPEYDRVRAVASHNPQTDKHPKLIARCVSEDDVAHALGFAREQSLEIAVRGGGHDLLGASVCEGGIVIDLGPMKGIRVDPTRQRARVEAGARSRDLNRAAGTHGLGAVLGCHPDVGVAGLLRWLASAAGAGGENGLA